MKDLEGQIIQVPSSILPHNSLQIHIILTSGFKARFELWYDRHSVLCQSQSASLILACHWETFSASLPQKTYSDGYII